MTIKISGTPIGSDFPPFIIAEMSGNHNQSLSRALDIVDAAARSGAHAIKLQTYTADTMTLDVRGGKFEISDTGSLWYGKNLHELYQEAYTPWEWHEPIMKRAKQQGLICFSTPFDESAVDFLETLDVPAYKIASFENNHLPLISKAASTGKPLIISTGMASLGELEDAVNEARTAGCNQIVLLKCTSTYPASPKSCNIRTISHLKSLFNTEVGLSDHTLGIGVAVASVSLGATVIEKHFTLDRSDGGIDSAFSLEPHELNSLVMEAERAWQSLGSITYGPSKLEQKSLAYKRSIYACSDICEGEIFTEDNIRIVRPGDGAAPKFYRFFLGKKSPIAYSKGNPVNLFDNIS